jgi:alkylation response protein AidB-like acyl-CoA dehydrogenase
MDLKWTEEQEMLRETIRSLLAKYSSPEIVRELEDDPVGYRVDLWEELGRQGLLGLTLPEENGGSGMSTLEQVILYEEFGRALTASPHLVSCVLAARMLHGNGEWLQRIASGEAIASLAWLEPDGGEGPDGVQLRTDGDELTGEKIRVPFATSATRLLTLARTDDGIGLFLVDPAETEATQVRVMGSDAESLVRFDGTPAERIAGDGWALFEDAMQDGLIALAAFAIGGAERAHEMATEYAKERVQFDRPIGSFQGIAHPLAEMATEIAGARVLVYEAAWARANRPDVGPLPAMAKLYAADVFKRTTKVGQQVFGGIGFIRDLDMQLYFRRAKQLEISWWGPRTLEERIAQAELDTDRPFVGLDYGVPTT